jgi:hypothetical protein
MAILKEIEVANHAIELQEVVDSPVKLAQGSIYYHQQEDRYLVLKDNCIESQKGDGSKPPEYNNLLLRSLAISAPHRTICTILSGTGTDAVDGAIELTRAGGCILVQQPSTARYDSLSLAAIAALGNKCKVLTPAHMPGQIERQLKSIAETRFVIDDIALFGRAEGQNIKLLAQETLFNSYEHTCFLLNKYGEVKQLSGSLPLFIIPDAITTNSSIWEITESLLHPTIRTAMESAAATGQKVNSSMSMFVIHNRLHFVRIVCMPLDWVSPDGQQYLLIIESLQPEELNKLEPDWQRTNATHVVKYAAAIQPGELPVNYTKR